MNFVVCLPILGFYGILSDTLSIARWFVNGCNGRAALGLSRLLRDDAPFSIASKPGTQKRGQSTCGLETCDSVLQLRRSSFVSCQVKETNSQDRLLLPVGKPMGIIGCKSGFWS